MVKKIIPFIIVVVIAIIGMWSLFHPGLPPTHDGEYHVIRFYEFDKVLRSGIMYPRWAPDLNNGYGVPLFNFVYPLPNYVASLLHAFGFSFIDAFKYNLVLGTVIGALGMYLWARVFWGRLGGIVASGLYSFAPYRFVDVYIRGSVGEVWALAFAPFILWAISIFIQKNDKRYLPVISIGAALLIFSHNILALLFFGFIVLYTLALLKIKKDFKPLKALLLTFVLGLGLAAVFWLPALFEKKYVTGLEIFSVRSHFVELYQLLIPSWGSGFSGDVGQGLSPQIGLVNVLVLCMVFLILLIRRKKLKNKEITIFLLLIFLMLCALMLSVSEIVWNTIPLLNYFQFPWRLLSLVILIVPFLGGMLATIRYRYVVSLSIITLAVIGTYSYTIPAYYHNRDDDYYVRRPNFIHGTNSPGDVFNTVWFKKTDPAVSKFSIDKTGKIDKVHVKPTQYNAQIHAVQDTTVMIHTTYFPGWRAFYQDKQVDLTPTESGIMAIDLPKGTYGLSVIFTDTIIRHLSGVISILSVGILLYMIKKIKNENSHR